MIECPWCGQRKSLADMRDVDVDRGKSPAACRDCRHGNPELAWCRFHEKPEPLENFAARPVVSFGHQPECRKAAVIKASRKRGHDPIRCISCGEVQESWNYRGGQAKAPCCRACEDAHIGQRWCLDCDTWLSESMFNRTGVGGKFWTVRCKPCRIANDHGVTHSWLLSNQGVSVPTCGACGTTSGPLMIDHDHGHCPTSKGCNRCVRGWLCHSCNTAEGLLRTAARARMLADYMDRQALLAR